MLAENDNCTNKLTHYFPERKAIAASLQLHEANDSFGKGFHALKARVLEAHVLNCLMTGRCPHITAVTAEVPLVFSKITLI